MKKIIIEAINRNDFCNETDKKYICAGVATAPDQKRLSFDTFVSELNNPWFEPRLKFEKAEISNVSSEHMVLELAPIVLNHYTDFRAVAGTYNNKQKKATYYIAYYEI